MKRILLLFLCLCLFPVLGAQSVLDSSRHDVEDRRNLSVPSDTVPTDSLTPTASPLYVPVLGITPYLDYGAYGWGGLASPAFGGLDSTWRLHEGFNAQFGLSATVAGGKYAPRGVGFGQSAAFAYLYPLTSRLTIAAGIYAANMDWGAWHSTEAGVAGLLSYRLTDRVNLYTYGSKRLLPNRGMMTDYLRSNPFPLYIDRVRDRIGAAAEFKITPNATIGISVERTTYE